MNCIELAYRHAQESPDRVAIWMPGLTGTRSVTFAQLFAQAAATQHYLLRRNVRPGDTVLLVDSLGPRLYAAVLGLLGIGCSVVLVEPWMPVARIEDVVNAVSPRAFLAGGLGKLWGMRVASIRSIPQWIDVRAATHSSSERPVTMESVAGEEPAILTFTSGTTGRPKGVVRSHQFLVDQHRVLEKAFDYGRFPGADLCIFANFTLANLASGRTTLLIPPAWRPYHLKQLDRLPPALLPETLTCGPAFLLSLMRHARVPSLKSIHVGGALTDCWIFEQGFDRWPDAHWTHVYGSTEAEPVALADAREAVARSRDHGFFQTLYIGRPIDDIRMKLEADGVWVTGPHVCPAYVGDEDANRVNKRKDEAGSTWHFMGDRLIEDDEGLWYAGRSNQDANDFDLEQQIYAELQSSKSFVHRTACGAGILIGEVDASFEHAGIDAVRATQICRDRRHRARIDRHKTLMRR